MSGGGERFLPYAHQLVEEDDIDAVAAVLRSDFLTTGPAIRRYEQDFAACVGAGEAVACASGTAALHLAALALGLGPGDAAIVPAVTFLATANAVRFTGAEVVFADVDPASGLMTPQSFAAAVARAAGARVKAALPVHLGGAAVDVARLAEVAARHGIAIVEDACHALGARVAEGRVGACVHSAMAVFSTHPAKSVTTGEGGVVTLNDAGIAARMARLRSHGMEHDPARWLVPEQGHEDGAAAPWYYEMAEMGCNYRITDIACALGSSQLKKLDRFLARRSELAARYTRLLAPLGQRVLPPSPGVAVQPGWHLYAARIDFAAFGRTRTQVMRDLRARGIGTQVHYMPLHLHPYYRKRYGELRLPGAEAYYARALSLPLYPAMREEDVDRVVAALREALGAA